MKARLPFALSLSALVVALLGATPVGHAVTELVVPRNSVGTAQLKNNAVVGAKVKDGSLLARDFASGQLPAGPAGPAGPPGPAGLPGLQLVGGESGFDASQNKSATARCPAGKKAISWSARIQLSSAQNQNSAPVLTAFEPLGGDVAAGQLPDGYTVHARSGSFYPDAWKLFAYAVCANSG